MVFIRTYPYLQVIPLRVFIDTDFDNAISVHQNVGAAQRRVPQVLRHYVSKAIQNLAHTFH